MSAPTDEGVEILYEGRDDARLAALSERGLKRRDLTPGMRVELARVLDPAGRAAPPEGRLPWIHLPWRGALLRVLDRDMYRRVRLSRNREVINLREADRLGAARIGVVGQSVGHTMARALAMEGIGGLRLIDDDALELSNLNRVPLGLPELGLSKVVASARRIWELDPFTDVDVWPGALAPQDAARFVEGLDVVVDACDSFAAKASLRAAAAAARVPLIMETSYRGTLDLENYLRDPTHRPFHGAMDGPLPTQDSADGRVALFQRLLGPLTERVEITLRGLGTEFVSYPQTASDIMVGAASVARLVRALVLGADIPSGRWRFDLAHVLEPPTEGRS